MFENHRTAGKHRTLVEAAANVPLQVEPLEDRFLLSGSHGNEGRGGDDDRGNHRGHFKRVTTSQLVATADFNGDEKADLVSVDQVTSGKKGATSSSLTVRLGDGKGRFDPTALKVNVGNPAAVLTGDFNGDDKADIALVIAPATATGATNVTILTGKGDGKFNAPATQSVGRLPAANVAAGDVNGDGFADLLSFDDEHVYESLNDGAGRLLPAVQLDNPFPGAVPVAAGDLFSEGRLDLVGVTDDGQIFFNRADPDTGIYNQTLIPTFGSTIPLDGKRIAVGDVNGDGRNDLLALGDGSVSVALADLGHPLTYLAWTTRSVRGVDAVRTLVGDVDGDGKVDLFEANGKDGAFRAKLVQIGNGDGTFHALNLDDDDDDDGEHDEDDHGGADKGRGHGHAGRDVGNGKGHENHPGD